MSRDSLREKAPIHAGLALLTGVLVALQLSDPEPGLLYLAPAILLLAALAFDRYPGERLLAAAAHVWQPVRRCERAIPAQRLLAPRSFPRGGVLLAHV